ncbi:MAG: DUF1559 domain-containing protein [Planctomycetota bacterium]|nr:DUF1559 domain-containing protein [Planctomycetota bacterium]
MGHHEDYYDANSAEPNNPERSSNRRGCILLGVLVSGACLIALFALLIPAFMRGREQSGKTKCANNLKGVGIAMINYSNDYHYFPHMTGKKEGHTNEQISDVYRTLIQQKYCETAEPFSCHGSGDAHLQRSQKTLDNPTLWDWKGKVNSAEPACLNSSKVDVLQNNELSYTYRRKRLHKDQARSDTILTADKARKDSQNEGCHYDGYNIGYADGHVEFANERETMLIERLRKRLIIGH